MKHIRLDLAEDGFSADNASGAAFWAALQEGKNDEIRIGYGRRPPY